MKHVVFDKQREGPKGIPAHYECAGCQLARNSLDRKLPPGWTVGERDGAEAVLCRDCSRAPSLYGAPPHAVAAETEADAGAAEGIFIRTWPPALDDALASILGMEMWELGPAAAAYRAAGFAIPDKAESERAFILHRYIRLWVEHGDDWRASAERDLVAMVEAARRKAPSRG
jgi:hypothetical protein